MPPHEHHHPDRPVSREQIEHALGVWRAAQHEVERQLRADWWMDYERAIAAGVSFLRRYTTMQELVQAYAAHVTDEQGRDPFEHAVRQLTSGHILNYALVEEASYFRRAQELIAHAQP